MAILFMEVPYCSRIRQKISRSLAVKEAKIFKIYAIVKAGQKIGQKIGQEAVMAILFLDVY